MPVKSLPSHQRGICIVHMLTGKPKPQGMVIPWENNNQKIIYILIIVILYRLSSHRRSKAAIDTQSEMDFASFSLLRYSQCLWKHRNNTINNEGSLAFDYGLEDIDKTDTGADVFNGQESVLWNNVRACFPAQLKSMYQTVRAAGLTFDEVENRFETHQAKWSASIFNEDAYYKYIEPLITGTALDESGELTSSDAYLPMCQGSKAEQRKWWLYNRFRYLDSKYETGLAASSYINFRAYANGNFKITPYADIYARVQVGSTPAIVRAKRNTAYTMTVNRSDANDTEVMIYSADQLKDVGDLSVFKPGYCNISAATKLQKLKIGSTTQNLNFGANGHTLTLGNNTLLQSLDVRNCPNLTTTIDASACKSLQEVLFEGSGITGINLPNGGVIKTLHLPKTITNLTIKNQEKITDFKIDNNDYSNISTIVFESVSSAVPIFNILYGIATGSRVRLIDINWTASSTDEVLKFFRRLELMRGVDANGNNTDIAQVSGKINIDTLYMSTELQGYLTKYSDVHINSDNNGYLVSFYNDDGTQCLYTTTSYNGAAVTYGGATPTKTSTIDKIYTFTGWTATIGGEVDDDLLTTFTQDTIVYAVFLESPRHYTIKFSDGTNILQTSAISYGTTPTYFGANDPVYQGSESKYSTFLCWSPIPYATDQDQTYMAQYTDTTPVTVGVVDKSVQKYESSTLTAIPSDIFRGATNLLYVTLPNVTSVGARAFYGASSLMKVDLTNVTSIAGDAFRDCTALTDIYLRGNTVCSYLSSNDPKNSKLKIHVPANLLAQYKTATNWVRLASKFVAINENE